MASVYRGAVERPSIPERAEAGAARVSIPPAILAQELGKPFFVMFLVVWVILVTGEFLGIDTAQAWHVVIDLLLLSASACTISGLGRELPWQTVTGAIVSLTLLGVGIEWMAHLTGLPLGGRVYEHDFSGFTLSRLDGRFPAYWLCVVLAARAHARWCWRQPRTTARNGLWVIASASALGGWFGLAWPGFIARDENVVYGGLPLENGPWPVIVAAWLMKSLAIFGVLMAAGPWFIRKQPGDAVPDPYGPAVWSLGLAYLCLVHRSGTAIFPLIMLVVTSAGLLAMGIERRRRSAA